MRNLSRQVVCEKCGKLRRTQHKHRDICQPCLKKEPSFLCPRCHCMTHHPAEATGLCPRCVRVMSRPIDTCKRCSRVRIIHDQQSWLCKSCVDILRMAVHAEEKQVKAPCSVCGKMRSSVLLGRPLCGACSRKERNGQHLCNGCGKLTVIHAKERGLCKLCYKNHLAPDILRRYVIDYATPYPYNKALFDFLVTTINWETITDQIYLRFKAFGQFLQTHQLSNPLSWEAIEEVLPPLGRTNRSRLKRVRACLFDLRHLLVVRGKLESRETYLARRHALQPMKQVPPQIQPLLHRYVTWLWERQTSPSCVRDHLEVLAAFWTWSERQEISSPEQVQAPLINHYLLSLYWQWCCSACKGAVEFESENRKKPHACPLCSAIGCLSQEKRFGQNTVRGYRAKLWVFFDWAKVNRLVLANPVLRTMPAPEPTIQHYSPEMINSLCEYITSPDADAAEALTLYLIIFHALSVRELRHAQLPTIFTLQKDLPQVSLVEAYYIILPRPVPTVGDRTPGRPDIRLDFPPAAASWLKPLLERFERQRQLAAKNPKNRYVFLAPNKARHNTPVSGFYVRKLVQNGSLQAVGATCNPSILRKTAGVLFADRVGAGVLRWMGWDEQQAFAYSWATREIIQPQHSQNLQASRMQTDAETMNFPSPKRKSRECES